jgi:uncharacterized repeat protein (TIGR03847 family)
VVIDLDPVDRITAGAVGPPGQRAFYLQATKDGRVVTLLLEKQHVELLSEAVMEILSRLGMETGEGPPEEAMSLEDPVVPEWRAGRLSIGYEEGRDLLLLEAEEFVPDDDEDDEDEDLEDLEGLGIELETTELPGEDVPDPAVSENWEEELQQLDELDELQSLEGMDELDDGPAPDPAKARFWATREQMRSLARHGAAVCAQGRPRCQLCGNPIDPEGHQCPALNGHREPSV